MYNLYFLGRSYFGARVCCRRNCQGNSNEQARTYLAWMVYAFDNIEVPIENGSLHKTSSDVWIQLLHGPI